MKQFFKIIFKFFLSLVFLYFFSYIKTSKDSSAKYYLKKQRQISKKDHERYHNLSEEEKAKKTHCDPEQYKNLSKSEKQKLVECRKKHYKARQNKNALQIKA